MPAPKSRHGTGREKRPENGRNGIPGPPRETEAQSNGTTPVTQSPAAAAAEAGRAPPIRVFQTRF